MMEAPPILVPNFFLCHFISSYALCSCNCWTKEIMDGQKSFFKSKSSTVCVIFGFVSLIFVDGRYFCCCKVISWSL